MIRFSLNLLAFLLMVASVAVIVLWGRSYWRSDGIWYDQPEEYADTRDRTQLSSFAGAVSVGRYRRSVEPTERAVPLHMLSRTPATVSYPQARLAQPWSKFLVWRHMRFLGLFRFDFEYQDIRKPKPAPVLWPGQSAPPTAIQLERRRSVTVPHWFVAAILGSWPALRFQRWRRRRRRNRAGQCTDCG